MTSGDAVTALVFSGMWAVEPGNWVTAGLIPGGAAGNLADRLLRAPGVGHRGVVDFLCLDWWPRFAGTAGGRDGR